MSSNNNSNTPLLQNLPTWTRVVAVVGIPGAIALYLVYTLTGVVAADVRSVRESVQQHQQSALDHAKATEGLAKLLGRICVNTAKTPDAVEQCIK